MPLQNRVTPTGDVIATPHRGMFTGNRGIIHDPATKTLLKKRWSTSAWITCLCEFRGWRRPVMARRSWTELFFLDEATAFAAGHRPCFFCRRDDAKRFRAAWEKGNGVSGISAKAMDVVLHQERLDRGRKRLHELPMPLAQLPDGAMVQQGDESFLVTQGKALRWSFAGYAPHAPALDRPMLLTPPSTLRAIIAGYQPVLHPTARS
ncbi:hypothetical protein A5906_23970 [Bradyrhizobium sacchari]|uniref:Uncharacterized protein n=1 Tax=Bradyrhizobium sacchari TaxID=1399419 RepID=A0A1V5EHQ8_9BRAD|nr:hypothetical protein [Bradyrhizobium sacchari]OPY93868.1 hypothetical protein A5906_16230 [Bradyrhizobium sacchari]OPY94331.1 hypothetical protein A5906_14465 [Bradyrhizobium sacchari]OPY99899.1 hypothetical protein A5906_23970 [Bradyrhizobium sacchari]TWB53950.1 hypothetical protein FBZ94_108234 [Bradyrhizobium sacchari]TWB78398.1 hypothetical protein FBZ95_103234 [Bradyrhizobium sacchari]